MTRVVDLGDRLAQLRSRRSGEPVTVTFADRTWTVPTSIPFAVLRYLNPPAAAVVDETRHLGESDEKHAERVTVEQRARGVWLAGALDDALASLFGDDLHRFLALGLDGPECDQVVDWIVGSVYGTSASPGNSAGSSEPSATTSGSQPSSSTSKRTSGSTSGKRSRPKKSTG